MALDRFGGSGNSLFRQGQLRLERYGCQWHGEYMNLFEDQRRVKVGDRFRHFKTGHLYKIVSLFTWEATNENSVEYENEQTGERWGRTLKNFLEEVSHNNQTVKRFAEIESADLGIALYILEEHNDNGIPYWDVWLCGSDTPSITLKNGCANIIVLSYLNMARQAQQRGNDYMAGVVQGCIHTDMVSKCPPLS